MTLKILNLYAGIGGNRKLWKGDIEVTAVELNPKIAKIYHDFFPNDKIIVADAHDFLLSNYTKYDFIWSSPPCQSHSQYRKIIGVDVKGFKAVFPDLKLYEEIIFLQHYFKGKWIVENVKPYYDILIPAKQIQRHLFWSNFKISNKKINEDHIGTTQIPQLQKIHGFDLSKYKIEDKRQILRNCVNSELGLHIFECAFVKPQRTLT